MAKKASTRELQNRWTLELTRQAYAALSSDPPDYESLDRIFGKITVEDQEYWDCRGFAPESMVLDPNLTHIDFSYSRFTVGSGFCRGRLESCLLRNIRYPSVLSSHYVSCDFSNANFRSVMSNMGARFENCVFSQSKFPNANFLLTHFENCLFEENDFKKWELSGCKFINCTFLKPVFHETYFAACKMQSPAQNIKWFDLEHAAEKSFIVSEDSPWLELDGVHVYDLKIK